MKKLFLLKADFKDSGLEEGKRYFCPDCALIEGLLSYYTHLDKEIEVKYLNDVRPRTVLVDLIGEENQSCPVLVLEDGSFINETMEIVKHLSTYHRVGLPHE